jgi:hypothetical protein
MLQQILQICPNPKIHFLFLISQLRRWAVYSREGIEGKKPFWAVDSRTRGLEIAYTQENTGKMFNLVKGNISQGNTLFFTQLALA